MFTLENIKKHPILIRTLLEIAKPAKFILWIFIAILGIALPVYCAQIYENYVYSLGQLSNIMASHYTQMISFYYNTASLATVVLGYVLLKHLYKILNSESAISKMIKHYPEAEKYLTHQKLSFKKLSLKHKAKETKNK